ncbi:MAG: MATE family efflux transporter [Bacteroidetes bacterium]|nr:MATE family efflux transporter [Bacteroidota bacterium]MBU2505845.1 MATE family efflux transporter [Bacteroidota bacterium]
MLSEYKIHAQETIKLAMPIAIGQLSHVMLGVVDSLMVGQIGAIPLAASALVNGLFFLILIFGIGMTTAITPLVAIKIGSKKNEECGIILRQALLVNIVFSVILMVCTYAFSEIIQFLNQPPEVVVYAQSYMKLLSYSILPFIIFQAYRSFIEGLSLTKPAMYINISANFVNAFLNWIFIFGNLGFPRMELDGAGYATLFTRCFIAVTIFIYVINKNEFKQYNPSLKFRGINLPVIKKIIRIGLPTGFQMFFEVGAFSFSAIMIGWIGAKELAAHQIAISLASITFMFILGISAAATIRVGNEVGRKDQTELRKAGFTAIIIAASIMAFFGSSFIALRNFLPTLFIDDVEVISIAASLLIVAAFFQISDGVQALGMGVLRGMTDVKVPMYIAFVAYWMIGIPLGYVLGFVFNFGVVGIWVSLSIGLSTAAILLSLRFNFNSKKLFKNK